MGFYVIATTTGDVDTATDDEQVAFQETSQGWIGSYRGERLGSVFLDMSEAEINIIAKFKAKHPNTKFIPTEDGEMFGLNESRI